MEPFPYTSEGVFIPADCLVHAKKQEKLVNISNYDVMVANTALSIISKQYNIPKIKILSPSRTGNLPEMKILFIHAMVIKTMISDKAIGGFIDRDHSTIVHARNRHDVFMESKSEGFDFYRTTARLLEENLKDFRKDYTKTDSVFVMTQESRIADLMGCAFFLGISDSFDKIMQYITDNPIQS